MHVEGSVDGRLDGLKLGLVEGIFVGVTLGLVEGLFVGITLGLDVFPFPFPRPAFLLDPIEKLKL